MTCSETYHHKMGLNRMFWLQFGAAVTLSIFLCGHLAGVHMQICDTRVHCSITQAESFIDQVYVTQKHHNNSKNEL